MRASVPSDEQYLQTPSRALDLLIQPGVDRLGFMKAISDAVPGSRTAVLLWLHDVEWSILVLDRYASPVTNEEVPKPLAELFVEKGRRDWSDVLITCTPVRHWAQNNGFSVGQAVVPVGSPTTIGYLHLLSDIEISDAAILALAPLCTAFGAFLRRGRTARRLAALDEIQERGEGATSVRDWLARAAEVALTNTSATACLAFREMPGGGFRADAAAKLVDGKAEFLDSLLGELEARGVSVIRRVAQIGEPRRIPRFYKKEMRKRAFGSEEHDEKLGEKVEATILGGERILSVLIAPVMFEQHAIAVFVLLNKRTESHLSAIFSETDAVMLNSVCKYLSGLLPSTVMNEAARAVGKLVSPSMLTLDSDRERLFRVIEEAIPGVTGAALVREQHRRNLPRQLLLGGGLTGSDADDATSHPDEHVRIPNSERFLFATQIGAGTLDYTCHLVIESTRDFLTDFERGILNFFIKGLLHPLLLAQNLDSLLELRHALRGGLTGVIGYVNEAMTSYNLYRDGDHALSLLSKARFRKALERARFAAEKTNQLLEASRVILDQLNRASLHLAPEQLGRVLKRVIDILRPFAEERRVGLTFDNDKRDGVERVTIDRLLIEMMIFNLVDNAIKYSKEATTVAITLAFERDRSVIKVTDHGIPIQSEYRAAIFEPFVGRRGVVRSDSRPGTGIGLPVAKRIVEAHGGVLLLQSRPLHGGVSETTFEVRIPRVLPRENK